MKKHILEIVLIIASILMLLALTLDITVLEEGPAKKYSTYIVEGVDAGRYSKWEVYVSVNGKKTLACEDLYLEVFETKEHALLFCKWRIRNGDAKISKEEALQKVLERGKQIDGSIWITN